MYEIELKFVIPEGKITAVKNQTNVKTAKRHTLDAYYFDTPDQLLGKAGIALRIRCENGNWVQTLKAKSDKIGTRIEENIALDLPARIAQNKLQPDLHLHSKAIQERLAAVLALDVLHEKLTIKFATKVKRITREIKRYGNIVEVAFDEGKIISGRKSSPICEIEFELLQGEMGFLIETASAWVKRHQLWYSTISKAEAGSRLFSGNLTGKVVKANLKALNTSFNSTATTTPFISKDTFLRLVVQNCLEQILPNLSDIATSKLGSKDNPLDGNHVHQARVGMRRLRTALKSFSDFTTDTQTQANLLRWQEQIKETFNSLGCYRDLEILKTKTQPMLEAHGAPKIDWQLCVSTEQSTAVQNTAFQLVLLEMIAFSAKLNTTADAANAKPAVSAMLAKLFKKLSKDSMCFAELESEQQHDVRKRLKKLRYLCEFAAPLYVTTKTKTAPKKKRKNITPPIRPEQFINYLEPAQDLLGEFNDAAVGHTAYLALAKKEPKAWFAVGYFTASEASAAEKCAVVLKTIKQAPYFW